jgi:3-oxoacyl-[acyl-carrier-protein] synthase-3
MTRVRIAGWGKHLPLKVVTNDDLALIVDTSDEWIRTRTGIQARRIAQDDESASSLGAEAARRALEQAGIAASDVDLIICATATPDRIFPSTASLIQHAIGARRAAAFDLGAACSGFVYAFVTASQFIASGAYRTVLVVGSEIYSRILDWTDRNTCVLFGDGAGAMVLQASEGDEDVLAFTLGSDGSYRGRRLPASGWPAGAQDAGWRGVQIRGARHCRIDAGGGRHGRPRGRGHRRDHRSSSE